MPTSSARSSPKLVTDRTIKRILDKHVRLIQKELSEAGESKWQVGTSVRRLLEEYLEDQRYPERDCTIYLQEMPYGQKRRKLSELKTESGKSVTH